MPSRILSSNLFYFRFHVFESFGMRTIWRETVREISEDNPDQRNDDALPHLFLFLFRSGAGMPSSWMVVFHLCMAIVDFENL